MTAWHEGAERRITVDPKPAGDLLKHATGILQKLSYKDAMRFSQTFADLLDAAGVTVQPTVLFEALLSTCDEVQAGKPRP